MLTYCTSLVRLLTSARGLSLTNAISRVHILNSLFASLVTSTEIVTELTNRYTFRLTANELDHVTTSRMRVVESSQDSPPTGRQTLKSREVITLYKQRTRAR